MKKIILTILSISLLLSCNESKIQDLQLKNEILKEKLQKEETRNSDLKIFYEKKLEEKESDIKVIQEQITLLQKILNYNKSDYLNIIKSIEDLHFISFILFNSKEYIWANLPEQYPYLNHRLQILSSENIFSSKHYLNAATSNNHYSAKYWASGYIADTVGIDIKPKSIDKTLTTHIELSMLGNAYEFIYDNFGENLTEKVFYILEKSFENRKDLLYINLNYIYQTTANIDYTATLNKGKFTNSEYELQWDGVKKLFYRIDQRIPGLAEKLRSEIKSYLEQKQAILEIDFTNNNIIKIDEEKFSRRRISDYYETYTNSENQILYLDSLKKNDLINLEKSILNGAIFDSYYSRNNQLDLEICLRYNSLESIDILHKYGYFDNTLNVYYYPRPNEQSFTWSFIHESLLMKLVQQDNLEQVRSIITMVKNINYIGFDYNNMERDKTKYYTALDIVKSQEMEDLLREFGAQPYSDIGGENILLGY